jgi:hypothetical protein
MQFMIVLQKYLKSDQFEPGTSSRSNAIKSNRRPHYQTFVRLSTSNRHAVRVLLAHPSACGLLSRCVITSRVLARSRVSSSTQSAARWMGSLPKRLVLSRRAVWRLCLQQTAGGA